MSKTWKEVVESNYAKWQEAIASGDAKAVKNVFSWLVVFLPTFLGRLLVGLNDLEEYFVNFLQKCRGVFLVEDEVILLGRNCYLHAVMQNFQTVDGIVRARFTMIWKRKLSVGWGKWLPVIKRKWKVIHFHSSVLPEGDH